ncbi:ABC transporter permease [Martelella mangrovi]|uniref:ABC-2 type transport system permease protein n=1 Tax=Martelella mangrovi TaxID=1397477 RepID=A0ABV2ID47_9HYPH
MKREFMVWLHLVRLSLKSGLQYRGAFILHMAGMIANYIAIFAGIWVVLRKFNELGGWTWPQMGVLLAFQLFTYALGAAFSQAQFRGLGDLIRSGNFDVTLTRPIRSWAYVIFSNVNTGYAGHFILALTLMFWALSQPGIPVRVLPLIYLFLASLSGAMVVASIFMTLGAFSMIAVEAEFLTDLFFGFWELTRYPLTIFPVFLQWLLVTVLPLGFFSFVPVSVFLNKGGFVLGDAALPLSLFAGPVMAAVAGSTWIACLRKYQSAGG